MKSSPQLRAGTGRQELEIDSGLPLAALAASWVLFTLVSLLQSSVASVRRDRAQWLASQDVRGSVALLHLLAARREPSGPLSILRHFLMATSLLSGVALVISLAGVDWLWISLGTLGVVSFLGLSRTAATAFSLRLGERIALSAASTVKVVTAAITPLLILHDLASRRSANANGNGLEASSEGALAEVPFAVDADGEPLDEREALMIRGIFRLDKTVAREIMVPRVDIVATDLDTTLDQLAELMVESGHSRIPVFSDSVDHIEGIAYSLDIVRILRDEGSANTLIKEVIRPALFIPEAKTLEELLNEFQEGRVHLAIVADEYGGVSGLVTIEDLLEEIVGEIDDEFDVGEPQIEPVGAGEFLMDARVSIDQLGQLLQVAVEGDGFDTVGGFVYQRLGKIPSRGDSVEYDGLRIEVVSTIGRRLKRLRVIRSNGDTGPA